MIKKEILGGNFIKENNEKINQEHLHNLLFSEELSWQAILYDLINTEQLDPWDIDISLLANKYLEKIRELEEANFFISSKVLFAASLLLRIKSEILLNRHIKSLDEILFGKKEEQSYKAEKIEVEEGDIPELVPKTPLPRFRKVTLDELIQALNKAINTESRRIKKELNKKNLRRRIEINLPKKRVNLKSRMREIYSKLKLLFKKRKKISFSEIAGEKKESRISTFVPLLYLEGQKKIWLEQEKNFAEIWILMYNLAKRQAALENLKEDIEIKKEELDNEQLRRLKRINTDLANPLGDFFELVS